MTIHLDQTVRDRLLRHALQAYPNECCGLLVGAWAGCEAYVKRIIQGENITELDPKVSFQVDWQTLFDTVKSLRESPESLLGVYHSHPDKTSKPSARDLELAWETHVQLILSVTSDRLIEMTCWRKASGEAAFERVPIIVS